MARLHEVRQDLLSILLDHRGSLPVAMAGPTAAEMAESPAFERIARAFLGLVAEPRVAAAAFLSLRGDGLLDPTALAGIDPVELEDALRRSRVKIAPKTLRPLLKLARWAAETKLDSEDVGEISTESLRAAWRGLKGIGPTTVDAILLLGLGRATYPIDRATYRILARHGWLDPSADYDEARSVAESLAPGNPGALDGVSAALGHIGRAYCKATSARCEACPLRPHLPEGGPIEGD